MDTRRQIKTILKQFLHAGRYNMRIDASGSYFLRLQGKSVSSTRKIVLIK